MSAASLDISVEQGATYSRELAFTDSDSLPIDVSGWTFRGQIRASYDAETALASFTFSAGAATNKKIMTLTDEVTAAIPVLESGGKSTRKLTTYIYDVEAEKPDGSVERILQGSAIISPEVTRT